MEATIVKCSQCTGHVEVEHDDGRKHLCDSCQGFYARMRKLWDSEPQIVIEERSGHYDSVHDAVVEKVTGLLSAEPDRKEIVIDYLMDTSVAFLMLDGVIGDKRWRINAEYFCELPWSGMSGQGWRVVYTVPWVM